MSGKDPASDQRDGKTQPLPSRNSQNGREGRMMHPCLCGQTDDYYGPRVELVVRQQKADWQLWGGESSLLLSAGRAFVLEAVRKSGDSEHRTNMKVNMSGNPQMLRKATPPPELSVLKTRVLWFWAQLFHSHVV